MSGEIVNLGEVELQIKIRTQDHKKLKDGKIPCYGSGGIMRYVDECLYDQESILIPRKGTLAQRSGQLIFFILTNLFGLSIHCFGRLWIKIYADTKFIYYQLKLIDFNRLNEEFCCAKQ
ncbi:MAG: hypothetical protein U5M23_00765 [Marinagarivorans sp.]|nr:hypothetical protein [Marinagarivorans sp.]